MSWPHQLVFVVVNASNKTARKSYVDLNVAGMAAHRELARLAASPCTRNRPVKQRRRVTRAAKTGRSELSDQEWELLTPLSVTSVT